MRVAVTGSTGLVGSALMAELPRRGHEAVAIVRRAAGGNEIAWNIEEESIERDKLAQVDAVIHLAGESIAKRWNAKQKNRIRDSRVQGTTLLSRALADLARRPATLISASAVGYYGDRGAETCDERTEPGHDFLANVCVAWEAAAASAKQAGIRVVHPRIGVVLSTAGGALPKMLLPFRLGLGGRVGSGQQYWSWITLADLVNSILFVLEREDVHGPVNATSPNPATNLQFTKALGSVLHRPTVFPVPALAARTLLGEMADALLLGSTRAVPRRLEESGYTFLHAELDPALKFVLGTP